jgi:alpha-L-arabinofuranosidase
MLKCDTGTDEFMHWLGVLSEGKEKRVEPYFCLNFGTGTLDEALAWVEYCNGTRNTYYANLRRKNGHEEPYNIKYWALGNEVCQLSISPERKWNVANKPRSGAHGKSNR